MIFRELFPSKDSSSQKNRKKPPDAVKISLFFRKNKWLLLICVLSLVLLLTFFRSKENEDENLTLYGSFSHYTEILRSDLEQTLSRMSGVGKCTVLITFSDEGERVYATDGERNESSGGAISERSEYVLVASRSDGLIIKIHTPSVMGVAVICEGGDSTRVKNDVTEVLSGTLGISADRISVKKLG